MKTVKITAAQIETFRLFNAERQKENEAKKAKEDYRVKLDGEHLELNNGEEVAFVHNGQVVATNQVTTRQAVSQTLLKTNHPKVYADVCVSSHVATLKVMLN